MTLPNDVMLTEVMTMLSEDRSVIIRAKGCSMLPFIRSELDSVELRAAEAYEPQDIVLAQISRGHFVLHRLVAVEGGAVTLRGDGNLQGVENCRLEDICGKAVRIIRRSGASTDCTSAGFLRRSRLWQKMPYIVRRVFLAFYRRISRRMI